MFLRPIYIALVIIVFCISCKTNSNKKSVLTEKQKTLIIVQELNNKAIQLKESPEQFEQALKLLDSALKIKPDYSFARDNKFYFFAKKKDYDSLLKMNLENRNYAMCGENFITRAVLFDLKNMQDSAKKNYTIGLPQFTNCLNGMPQWDENVAFLIQAAGFYQYSNQLDFSKLTLEKIRKIKGFENYVIPTKEEFIQKALAVRDGSNYQRDSH